MVVITDSRWDGHIRVCSMERLRLVCQGRVGVQFNIYHTDTCLIPHRDGRNPPTGTRPTHPPLPRSIRKGETRPHNRSTIPFAAWHQHFGPPNIQQTSTFQTGLFLLRSPQRHFLPALHAKLSNLVISIVCIRYPRHPLYPLAPSPPVVFLHLPSTMSRQKSGAYSNLLHDDVFENDVLITIRGNRLLVVLVAIRCFGGGSQRLKDERVGYKYVCISNQNMSSNNHSHPSK